VTRSQLRPDPKGPTRGPCNRFQARNRLCFGDSNSSSKSWIAFGVVDMGECVRKNISEVKLISQERTEQSIPRHRLRCRLFSTQKLQHFRERIRPVNIHVLHNRSFSELVRRDDENLPMTPLGFQGDRQNSLHGPQRVGCQGIQSQPLIDSLS
jgi:hypothetical protein